MFHQRRERKGRIDEVQKKIVGERNEKNDSAIANRFKLQRGKKYQQMCEKCDFSRLIYHMLSMGFKEYLS